MRILLKTQALLLILIHTQCSRVQDEHDEEALHTTDYCPHIGNCVEGSHVMCTHYNPQRKMGPMCSDVEKVSITPEFANILLDSINGIRSRAARGLSTGLDDMKLPRGYGILRVEWDPELATLAQLWANQCIISKDRCRATKKFDDPAQLAGVNRFTIPDWLPLVRREYFNETGFNIEKVEYALKHIVNSWYNTKYQIDAEFILDRNLDDWDVSLLTHPYLQIVQGSVTHIGCGISAFREYSYYTDGTRLNFNTIRLVCNLSTRLRDQQVYTTDPPTQVGYTVRCGCPLGYDEDPDCLCYQSGRGLPFTCKYGRCKPNVVILPIFTVENAPPDLLGQRNTNTTAIRKIKGHISNHHVNEHLERRNFNQSQFSKPFSFHTHKLTPLGVNEFNVMKRDVLPRKDFSNIQNILSDYLKKRRNQNLHISNKIVHEDIPRKTLPQKSIIYKTIPENKQQDTDILVEFNFPNNNATESLSKVLKLNSKEKSNCKFIELLNKLEEEAKNIQIHESQKLIMDRKIRTIYGTFLKKSNNSESKKNNNYSIRLRKLFNDNDKSYIQRGKIKRKSNYTIENMKSDYTYDDTKQTKILIDNEPFLNHNKLYDYEEQFYKINKNDFINQEITNIDKRPELKALSKNFYIRRVASNFKGPVDTNFRPNVNTRKIQLRNTTTKQKKYNIIHRHTNGEENSQIKNQLEDNNDLISFNRRKYYQNKLDNLKMKLRKINANRYQKTVKSTQNRMKALVPTFQRRRSHNK